jgi:hypothetical protein
MTEPSLYAQARADVAGMLGYDLDNLSAEQALRLDVASALRVLLDNQSARLVRGESLDARELLMASEALSRLLPPLREPPPEANAPDPREIMLATYMAMRRRGEIADSYRSPQQRLEAARAKVAEIEAELAAAMSSTAITPSDSDIVPPGELGVCFAGTPPAGPDDPPAKSTQVIDGKANPPAPAAPTCWDESPGGVAWHAWRALGNSVGEY